VSCPTLRSRIARIRPSFWVALVTCGLYFWPAISVINIDRDMVEYVDTARHLASGQGYTLAVKGFHIGGTDIVHNGLDERAPLYTLLIAGLMALGVNLAGLQLGNVLLVAGCAALVSELGTTLFDRQTGVLAGLLAAVSPQTLNFLIPIMTEALSSCLMLAATLALTRGMVSLRRSSFVLAGTALGLAYLTRPIMGGLGCCLFIAALLGAENRRVVARRLWLTGIAALVWVGPITVYSLVTRGSLSYLGQTYLFVVLRDFDVMSRSWLQPLPSFAEFIQQNSTNVRDAIAKSFVQYTAKIFFTRNWLLPCLPIVPVVLWTLLRCHYARRTFPLMVVAAGNFVMHALIWSAFQPRYQVLTLLALLPILVDALGRSGLAQLRWSALPRFSALCLSVALIAVVWSPVLVDAYQGRILRDVETLGTRSTFGIRWTGPPNWLDDRDFNLFLSWIRTNTDPSAAFAHDEPHAITFFTQRPAVRLADLPDTEALLVFVKTYRVSYVVIRNESILWRRYGSDLTNMEDRDVQRTDIGRLRVFDVRAIVTTSDLS